MTRAASTWRGRIHLPPQQCGGRGEQEGQHTKCHAPAQRLYRKAAKPLAGHHPRHRGHHQPGQGLLALFVGHLIANPGHAQRDDARRRSAHGRPRYHQRREVGRKRRDGAEERTRRRGPQHHAGFAQPVAQRAIKQLQHAIRHRKGRDHGRGITGADVELLRQGRQHRVAHAHRGHAGKSRQRHEAQRALGGFRGSGMHGGDCHDFVNEALIGVCKALHSSARRKCKQKRPTATRGNRPLHSASKQRWFSAARSRRFWTESAQSSRQEPVPPASGLRASRPSRPGR